MIALITPTGARHDQFHLCQYFMKHQSYKGEVVWIIVDDAYPRTTDEVTEGFRENWTIEKVYPTPIWQGENTQGRNIRAGIELLTEKYNLESIEAIFIIEDDDYYRPVYLEKMMEKFGSYWLIGETNTIYYNVQWRQFCDNNNRQHASLFQTAFTRDLLPLFLNCLGVKFIDADFWMKASNKYIFPTQTLSVGIKGMPGRGGIGAGHKRTMYFNQDQSLIYLKQLIGDEDAEFYRRYYGNNGLPQHDILSKKRL